MAIRIITDSSSDLPLSAAAALGVEVVPLSVQFGSTGYLDGETLDRDTFYDLLKNSGSFPTTSQPSPEAFLRHFEDARAAGDQVVAILLSGALSGTVQSARIAKELCGYGDVHVVDSRSAAAGIQLLIHRACVLRDGGAGAREIAGELEALKERIFLAAIVDTLEYLRRGGRLSSLAANIGTVTKLKPVITLRGGSVAVVGKAFGSAAAIKQLLNIAAEHPVDTDYPVHVVFTDDREKTSLLLPRLGELGLSAERVIYSGVGPAIGTHAGTGALGLAYIAK